MIARNNQRRREGSQPLARLFELAPSRTQGQVTGNDNNAGLLPQNCFPQLGGEPIGDTAKMKVGCQSNLHFRITSGARTAGIFSCIK